MVKPGKKRADRRANSQIKEKNAEKQRAAKRFDGAMSLTRAQLAYRNRKLSIKVRDDGKEEIKVVMDTDNFKQEIQRIGYENLVPKIEEWLEITYPNFCLHNNEVVAVGNMSELFGIDEEGQYLDRSTTWPGVWKEDVFGRCCRCKVCDNLLQDQSKNRPTVRYERTTDIADRYCQHLIFNHIRSFGAGTILIITGDGDFARMIELMKLCGLTVVLITTQGSGVVLRKVNCTKYELSDVI